MCTKLNGLPPWLSSKKNCLKKNFTHARDMGSIPGSERSPGGGHGSPPLLFLSGESYGQRSLVGSCSYGHKESVTTEATEHLHTKINKACFFSQVRVILVLDESMVQCDVCYN